MFAGKSRPREDVNIDAKSFITSRLRLFGKSKKRGATTLSITLMTITTLSIATLHGNIKHNVTEYNNATHSRTFL
jgi:hypothetical protein